MRKTRIIVPCYNESTRLKPLVFLRTLEKDKNLSFLFVNDGSTDTTLEIITSLKEKNPSQIEVISLEKNSGKAEAIRCGMLNAIEGSFDNIGYWDADLATSLEAIWDFVRILDTPEVDIVIGSRVRLLGRKVVRRASRHYLGRVFATCASLMLNICVYDTQCGAKIFRNTEALKHVFKKQFKVKWIFDVEMFARFSIVTNTTPTETSSRWVEFPLEEWIDVECSKVKLKDYFLSGLEFCLLFYYLRTPARKIYKSYLSE